MEITERHGIGACRHRGNIRRGVKAVSYTPLDVYKRQVYHSRDRVLYPVPDRADCIFYGIQHRCDSRADRVPCGRDRRLNGVQDRGDGGLYGVPHCGDRRADRVQRSRHRAGDGIPDTLEEGGDAVPDALKKGLDARPHLVPCLLYTSRCV